MIDEPLPPAQKPRYRYMRCIRGDHVVSAFVELVQHVSGCQECTMFGNPATGDFSALQRVGAERQVLITGNTTERCALVLELACRADA